MPAPIAHAEHHRPAGRGQRAADVAVGAAIRLPLREAPVDLEVVGAPGGDRSHVLSHVAGAARVVLAGVPAGVEVDAQLQAAGMHVVRQGRDAVREAVGLGPQRPVRGTGVSHPAVVQDDVAIPDGRHARREERVRRFPHDPLVHPAAERVEGVPAHRRRAGQPVLERAGPARADGQHEPRRDRDDGPPPHADRR